LFSDEFETKATLINSGKKVINNLFPIPKAWFLKNKKEKGEKE